LPVERLTYCKKTKTKELKKNNEKKEKIIFFFFEVLDLRNNKAKRKAREQIRDDIDGEIKTKNYNAINNLKANES
jgi:hypothetical protein